MTEPNRTRLKTACPTCGRTVQRLADGTVRRHKPVGDVQAEADGWCAGTAGKPLDGNVVAFRRPKPPPDRTGKARGMTPADLQAANEQRAPSRQLGAVDACGAPLVAGDRRGERCRRGRGQDTDHMGYGYCSKHGGTTPNGRKHAALERARREADAVRQAQTFYGRRTAVDPEQALLEELERSAGVVRYLEQQLQQWGKDEAAAAEMLAVDPNATPEALERARGILDRFTRRLHALEQGTPVTAAGDTVDTATGLPQLLAVHHGAMSTSVTDTEYAAWMKVYLNERKHLAAVARACVDAGIAQRRQIVLEARAGMMRALVLRALALAGVTMDEAQALPIIAEATRLTANDITA